MQYGQLTVSRYECCVVAVSIVGNGLCCVVDLKVVMIIMWVFGWYVLIIFFFFFFFQAEDGIRDLYVTGVQTCALPISDRVFNLILEKALAITRSTTGTLMLYDPDRKDLWMAAERGVREANSNRRTQIGRASCRERV